MFVLCLGMIILLPTTILLAVGMLPTMAALFLGLRIGRKSKVITVGAFNLAGCAPYLLALWTEEHSYQAAMGFITNPSDIVIIWLAAAIGYIFDWTVTNMITAILLQKAKSRKKSIEKRQSDLAERWGEGVSG